MVESNPVSRNQDLESNVGSIANFFSEESRIPLQHQPFLKTSASQPYYRQANESIGKSLYRDHLIREEKKKNLDFAYSAILKAQQDTPHKAPMTD